MNYLFYYNNILVIALRFFSSEFFDFYDKFLIENMSSICLIFFLDNAISLQRDKCKYYMKEEIYD